jgi:hypothetical protein
VGRLAAGNEKLMNTSPEAKQAAEEWGKGKYHTVYERECFAEGYDTATAKLELELQRANAKCAEQAAATAKLREAFEQYVSNEGGMNFEKFAAIMRGQQLAHQQPSATELLDVLKAMYLKHHCGYDDEGWNTLGDRMQNVLCNAMGDNVFCKWMDEERSKHE